MAKSNKSLVVWKSIEEREEVMRILEENGLKFSTWARVIILREFKKVQGGKDLSVASRPQAVTAASKPIAVEKTEAEIEEEQKQAQKTAKEVQAEMLKRFRS